MNVAAFRLDGKVALVTGAATGLGQAIAAALARQGADIAVTGKSAANLAETKALVLAHGRQAFTAQIDVREFDQIKSGVAAALKRFGHIDILVNNAGVNRPAAGLEVTPPEWDDHFHTNVRGGFFMAQAAAPGMIARRWGRIIFIASQSGLSAIPGQPVYCSSKSAVIQLARTLGVEWAKHGLTVNSIAPTFVETNLTRRRLQDPVFKKFVLGKIPCGQLATPDDIANAAVYLASEEAKMVNCATLCADGGWTVW